MRCDLCLVSFWRCRCSKSVFHYVLFLCINNFTPLDAIEIILLGVSSATGNLSYSWLQNYVSMNNVSSSNGTQGKIFPCHVYSPRYHLTLHFFYILSCQVMGQWLYCSTEQFSWKNCQSHREKATAEIVFGKIFPIL